MKKIKYKAKNIDGETVFGNFYCEKSKKLFNIIFENNALIVNALQEAQGSVVQFTGFFDSLGAEIYEGDTITSPLSSEYEMNHLIFWNEKNNQYMGQYGDEREFSSCGIYQQWIYEAGKILKKEKMNSLRPTH